MIFQRAVLLILAAMIGAAPAHGQTLRARVAKPEAKASEDRFSMSAAYAVTSDYASERRPRSYRNMLSVMGSYNLDDNWSIAAEAGAAAETVKGQVAKDQKQTYADVLNPSFEAELGYRGEFASRHRYTFSLHGAPLMDEASRLEGYKALVGVGAGVTFKFFRKRYSMGHMVDATGLANSFDYSSSGTANPDYFYSYKFANSIRFLGNNTFGVSFGAKVTRYLDGFSGYSYKNSVSLAHSWKSVTVTAAYENGGFTDEGRVSMWYVDEYRRILTVMMNYSF